MVSICHHATPSMARITVAHTITVVTFACTRVTKLSFFKLNQVSHAGFYIFSRLITIEIDKQSLDGEKMGYRSILQ
jgi:hypothetical protein